jgi:hypothetical protein
MFAATFIGGCGDDGLPPPHYDMAISDMSAVPPGDMAIPDDARKFVTFAMFALDYAQALCAHYMTCGILDAAQLSACIERNIPHSGWDQDIEIMKGRLEINELQCINAVNAARCDNSDENGWLTRCHQFLYTPHQADGATCLSFDECTSGHCQHAGSDGGTGDQPTGCPGTCAPPKNLGDPCRLAQDCGDTAYCPVVATPVCTKRAALGEDCTATPCQYGLLCPSFGTKTCQTPTMQTAVGGACDPIQGATTPMPACAAGMYCQLQYNGTTAIGGKCQMKIGSGMTCDPNNEGFYGTSGLKADNQCTDGTYCFQLVGQAGATCQGLGSANASCHRFLPNVDTCKVGFSCDNTDGKCVAWFSDGLTCDVSAHCPSILPGQSTCIADNADAGTNTTCQQSKNFAAPCAPGFEDSLCAPSDNANTSYCAPAGSSGVCQPKCF